MNDYKLDLCIILADVCCLWSIPGNFLYSAAPATPLIRVVGEDHHQHDGTYCPIVSGGIHRQPAVIFPLNFCSIPVTPQPAWCLNRHPPNHYICIWSAAHFLHSKATKPYVWRDFQAHKKQNTSWENKWIRIERQPANLHPFRRLNSTSKMWALMSAISIFIWITFHVKILQDTKDDECYGNKYDQQSWGGFVIPV